MKRKFNLTLWTFIGLGLGIVCGIIGGEKMSFLSPLGNIFVNLIKMVCIPLVMCSMITTVSSMRDMKKMGRISAKMLLSYVGTCVMAGVIALFIAFSVDLGAGITMTGIGETETTEIVSVLDVFLNIVPENIFSAMANFEMLPCLIFSIFFGLALALTGDKGKPAVSFFEACNHACFKVIEIVMYVSPVGIFALVASGIGASGMEILATLGIFVIFQYVAAAIMLIIYALMTHFSTGIPIKKLIPAYLKVTATAFSTRSSAATLPLTIKTSVEDLGCDEEIANFTLPIGCTINMNGFVSNLCMTAVLAGNIFGSPLTIGQCVTAVLIATMSGIGMPGIPNGGMAFQIMLFSALGLPTSSVLLGMIQGVGTLVDMINTTSNVCGDMACASIITASEKKRQKKLEAKEN